MDGCEACEGLEEEACDGLGGGVERDSIHTPMAYAMDNSNLLQKDKQEMENRMIKIKKILLR